MGLQAANVFSDVETIEALAGDFLREGGREGGRER